MVMSCVFESPVRTASFIIPFCVEAEKIWLLTENSSKHRAFHAIGGKAEKKENAVNAVIREIQEELGVDEGVARSLVFRSNVKRRLTEANGDLWDEFYFFVPCSRKTMESLKTSAVVHTEIIRSLYPSASAMTMALDFANRVLQGEADK